MDTQWQRTPSEAERARPGATIGATAQPHTSQGQQWRGGESGMRFPISPPSKKKRRTLRYDIASYTYSEAAESASMGLPAR